MATTTLDEREMVLQAVQAIAPEFRERALEGERLGTQPADLVAKAKAAGLFRLGLPRSLGGWEIDPLTLTEAIERLAHADGSAGWTVMIGNGSFIMAWLDPEVAAEMIGGQIDFAATGMFAPLGRAVPTGDGAFTLDGRWPFNSGCPHSEWLMTGAFVFDGDQPRVVPPGRPDWRFCWFRPADADIIDNWHVAGLRGTGSNDLTVTGLRVPEEHTASPLFEPARHDGPLWRLPFFTAIAALMVGIPLGIGRRALDEFQEVAIKKARGASPTTIAHDEAAQVQFARADGGLRAARTFVFDAVGDAWATVQAGDPLTLDQRGRVQLSAQNAMRAGIEAVDTAFHLTGGSALFEDNPLQRCFRDLHAASQHLFYSVDQWKRYAKVCFGIEQPTFML